MKKKENDYLFSQELRDHMSMIPDDTPVVDLLRDAAMLDHLLKFAMDDEDRKEIWDKAGNPDAYNCGDEPDEKTMEQATGNAPLEQDDIYELHLLRLNFFSERGLSQPQMMSYLCNEFVGSMALAGYRDKFARDTFDMMYEKFLTHPMRREID